MSEVGALLALLRLADSALPVGGYTLSHGLETYAAAGLIETPAALRELLAAYLIDQLAPGDGIAAAAAWTAATAGDLVAVRAIDQAAQRLRLAAEVRAAASRTGRRLLRLAPAWGAPPLLMAYYEQVQQGAAPGGYAVVFGLAAQQLGIERQATVLGLLHSTLLSLLAAAQRLTRLDHEQAQTVLVDLEPSLITATEMALAGDWRWLAGNAPEIEIMAMRHERQYIRLFAS